MYVLVNQREILPGTRNLPNYLGLVNSWILKEKEVMKLYLTSIILNSSAGNFISIAVKPLFTMQDTNAEKSDPGPTLCWLSL